MAIKHFQKQRLLKLADFIEALPRGKFDLNIIAKENRDGEEPSVKTCGTAACAIGWTPVVFPRACAYTFSLFDNSELSVQSKLSGKRDFVFAEEFFGLDCKESSYLFDPESYPSGRRGKKSVAARIRKFVAGNVSKQEIEDSW